MNSAPNNCNECPFYHNCNSGMYMKGCSFYGPNDKPVSIFTKIINLFKKH